MSGRIVHVPASAHRCEGKPLAGNFAPATIWECDDCKKQWVVVWGSQYNETYQAWRELTAANRDGGDNF